MATKYYFSTPTLMSIFITNRCNLRCKHCVFAAGEPLKEELSDEQIFNLIDKISTREVICLDFSGGEPLLHKSLFKFIDYAYEKGIKSISIATNSTLINEEIAKRYKKYQGNSDKFNLRISLDGSTAEIHDWLRGEGNFKAAINGLELLKKYNIRPREINMVIHKKNIDDIENVVRFAKEYNSYYVVILPLIISGRAIAIKEFMITPSLWKQTSIICRRLSKQYNIEILCDGPTSCLLDADINLNKPKPCMCGYQFLGISPSGEILPCPITDLSIGNIKNDDLFNLWLNSPILKDIREIENLGGKCVGCEYKIVCRGGCRGLAHTVFNNYNLPDPLCWK